eukprot:1189657-Prorocentrum_minimum.AAC.1
MTGRIPRVKGTIINLLIVPDHLTTSSTTRRRASTSAPACYSAPSTEGGSVTACLDALGSSTPPSPSARTRCSSRYGTQSDKQPFRNGLNTGSASVQAGRTSPTFC